MKKEFDQLFAEMRTSNLLSNEGVVFEIDLSDENIFTSRPMVVENSNHKELLQKLPPSFLKFIRNVTDGIHIEMGNSLTIFPVDNDNSNECPDIVSMTSEIMDMAGDFDASDFIFFAMTSVDSEMFAFYTAVTFENGEYPIVWFTPETLEADHFVLINSSFDRFLTIQYYLLKATEYEETYDTIQEAEYATSDKIEMQQQEENWQNFQNMLYDIFDPQIPKPGIDLYNSSMTLQELKEVIKEAS